MRVMATAKELQTDDRDPEAVARGLRLRAAREARGLSIRQVEQISGGKIDNGYLSRLERGERGARTGPEKLRVLAEILGVDYEELVLGSPAGERIVEREERYPNRACAITANKHRWSVAAAEQLGSVALKSDNDLSVAEWTKKGDAIEARVRGKAVGVVIDTDEDDTPPGGRAKKRRGPKQR
jgi:transcriptional regulator with XRE-family HTH domain